MTGKSVSYCSAKIDVGPQMWNLIRESQAVSRLIDQAITDDMNAMFDDWRDGPRLGPDRRDYDRIMEPSRRRQRIRARAQELMPGKRPGRFVR